MTSLVALQAARCLRPPPNPSILPYRKTHTFILRASNCISPQILKNNRYQPLCMGPSFNTSHESCSSVFGLPSCSELRSSCIAAATLVPFPLCALFIVRFLSSIIIFKPSHRSGSSSEVAAGSGPSLLHRTLPARFPPIFAV